MPLCQIVGGKFPRRYFVWWDSKREWYEGVASASCDVDAFNVEYSAKIYGKPEFIFCFVSTAHTPQPSLLQLDGMVLPVSPSLSPISVGAFFFQHSLTRRDRLSFMRFSDLIPRLPPCSPRQSLIVQPVFSRFAIAFRLLAHHSTTRKQSP